ncbi:hypothetical protein GGX14DRAFT_571366 [Mycena pura]|uniref:Uncharacterized protein n=1 Tax=Mycena pura TaxID=153505 RepID=A0AAD6V080_9AGAR|nr:hypothetical protein GGX14DRAFT_573147 [Mycena pura]KAJ7201723.1 hypothetical protein GGX14DRAFT_571366 [Mycena pura]
MDPAFMTFDASEIHSIVESFNKLLDKLQIAGQLTLGPDLETPKFEVLMHLWSAVYAAIHPNTRPQHSQDDQDLHGLYTIYFGVMSVLDTISDLWFFACPDLSTLSLEGNMHPERNIMKRAETVADLCVMLILTYVRIRRDSEFTASEKRAIDLLRAGKFDESWRSRSEQLDLTFEHAYYLSRRRSYVWIKNLSREVSTLKCELNEQKAQVESEIKRWVFRVSKEHKDTVESNESKM